MVFVSSIISLVSRIPGPLPKITLPVTVNISQASVFSAALRLARHDKSWGELQHVTGLWKIGFIFCEVIQFALTMLPVRKRQTPLLGQDFQFDDPPSISATPWDNCNESWLPFGGSKSWGHGRFCICFLLLFFSLDLLSLFFFGHRRSSAPSFSPVMATADAEIY